MLKAFGLQDQSWDHLADFINPDRKAQIGESDHIIWKEGVPILRFSKQHPGQPVFETIKRDPGYGNWVLRGNFPPHVKAIISAALKMKQEEFLAFIKSEFGEGSGA